MFGKSCVRTKTVFSPVLGRNVQRCAQFASGGLSGFGQLGAFPITVDQLKETGMTAVLAVGSAVGVRKLTGWWMKYIPMEAKTVMWLQPIAECATGLGGAYLIGRWTPKGDIAAAVLLGPVFLNGIELVGRLLAPSPPVAGDQPASYNPNPAALGAVVEQERLTPGWATVDPFLAQVQQQFPAWAMG